MAEELGVGGKDREDFLQQVMLNLALTNEVGVPGHYAEGCKRSPVRLGTGRSPVPQTVAEECPCFHSPAKSNCQSFGFLPVSWVRNCTSNGMSIELVSVFLIMNLSSLRTIYISFSINILLAYFSIY